MWTTTYIYNYSSSSKQNKVNSQVVCSKDVEAWVAQ